MYNENIKIGTLVNGGEKAASYISQILPYGFETFSLTFWETIGDTNLSEMAKKVNDVLAGTGVTISSLGVYGNPLMNDSKAESTRSSWIKLIDAAELFNCDIIAGFTGRLIDEPIDKSVPRFKEVFTDIALRAKDKGIRIAFENCDMGGDWNRGNWNIAHGPVAWEMIFDAIPLDNLGLQWEPCHQMVKLVDPMPQLRKWVSKIFHVHGKDATVRWDIVREFGVFGPKTFAFHRTPGFGDSNWTDIISELRNSGFKGSIDIEGWHDPIYRGELEMMGQVHGLNYLKKCRGGTFYPNPK